MPQRSSYAEGTPSWVDLATTDPEGAQTFYGALFGWEYDSQPTSQGSIYTSASVGGKAAAGMMKQPEPQVQQGMPPMWNSYITVDDLDTSLAKTTEAGGQVIMPAMPVEEAGIMAVIVDPAGAAVALWQPLTSIGAEVVNEHGSLIWNELISSDLDTALDFYSQVFGWTIVDQEMPTGPYKLCNLGEETVAGAMAPPAPEMPNHWSVYFGVDDADAAAKAISDNGGKVLAGPMDIGIGTLVTGQDPQGAVFQLMQPAAPTT